MSTMLENERWRKEWGLIKPSLKSIFYKGQIDLLTGNYPRLAIVGSRRMTSYGARVIENWIPEIVNAGVVIVSGFMYGVDQAVHKTCLSFGGKTIAVLGWGIDHIVSGNDMEIYEKILEVDSLIVSEYDGQRRAEKWTFPARDRVMAGVSDAVLVIEAAKKSGSLITAKYARQFGKKVMAVPGQVTSKLAEGTNNLIKRGDAILVSSAFDILKEMSLAVGQMPLYVDRYTSDPLLLLLSDEPKTADEISRILKVNMSEVLIKLTELSLSGQIEEKGGRYWKR